MDHATTYETIAGEYYDPAHVTSRNFDAATVAVATSWRDRVPGGLVLEPGCGRGRVGEFLGVDPDRVVQMDNSPAMLSLEDREPARLRVLHEAEALPFPDGAFGCVAAFLCDGFLGLNFLSEARRVLGPGGVLCGTTPSYEWGLALRESLEIDIMSTRFVLHGGGQAFVPSFLYRKTQLNEMLSQAAFGDSREILTHTVPESVSVVSDDIVVPAERLGVLPKELPILYSFWAVA